MEALSKLGRARWARTAVTLALLAAALFFFRNQLGFIQQGATTVRSAALPWVALGIVLCAASFVAMAEVMVTLLHAGGCPAGRGRALALVLAANAWSGSLPGGPALSTVLQYRAMRGWGASPVVIGWFVVLSSALSTLWLILLGLGGIVFLGADFSVMSLLGTAILLILAVVGVYWLANHPELIERTLAVFRLNKPAVSDHLEQLRAVQLSLPRFSYAALMSLLNRLLDLACLWASIRAVSAVADIPGTTLAFLTAKIVGATGITPGGLGPLEAALTASLTATGLSAGVALAAVLVYRMVSFILPMVVGWVTYFMQPKEKL